MLTILASFYKNTDYNRNKIDEKNTALLSHFVKSAVDFSNLPSNCRGEVLSPQIDEKIQAYAASLDKTQRDEDSSLGVVFAQKVRLICK